MFALLKMIDPGVPVRDPNEVLTFGSVILVIIARLELHHQLRPLLG